MPATEIGTSERLLEELRLWVEMETPTTDAAAVNRLVDRAEAVCGRPRPRWSASPAATAMATT